MLVLTRLVEESEEGGKLSGLLQALQDVAQLQGTAANCGGGMRANQRTSDDQNHKGGGCGRSHGRKV